MSNSISNQFSLGKISDLIFARQTPFVGAERHNTLIGQIQSWRARRAAEAELSRLSDRELADIGLTRQGIRDAVQRR
jgi:uncharacterized protein YjiS (DUF1127 family)